MIKFKNDEVDSFQIKISSALKRCGNLLDGLSYKFEANALDSFNGFDQNYLAYLKA